MMTVRIDLTREQVSSLEPLLKAVAAGSGSAIIGQVFTSKDIAGYADFRFLDSEQIAVVKPALLATLDIEKRRKLEDRRKEIVDTVERLENEKAKIDSQIAQLELSQQSASAGCTINGPLLTKDCPDCNPPKRDWASNRHNIPAARPRHGESAGKSFPEQCARCSALAGFPVSHEGQQLVHSAFEMFLTRIAKYNDPDNEEWDWDDVTDKWERHAFSVFRDLMTVRAAREGSERVAACKWVMKYDEIAVTGCGHVFNNWPNAAVQMTKESYAGRDAFKFCPFCAGSIEL